MDVFTAMSIFTGYDGIGIGLKRAIPNFRTICYVEREIFPVCNLVAKIKENKLDDAPIWDDIATFDGKPFAGMVDILHAGIPCQPWSVAGKQKGVEDERWVWDDMFRVIVEVRPNYIFLEEVPGFVRGGGLGFVLSDLAKAGYDAEWDCFTAAEVGAPHKRERLFILAHAESQRPVRESTGICGEDGRQGGTLLRQLIKSSTTELANSSRLGRRGRDNGEPAGQGRALQAEGPGELADAGRIGQTECQEQPAGIKQYRQRWPTRPGQEQYDWECPRTLPVTKGPKPTGWDEYKARIANATQSELGGTVNGITDTLDAIANRVDRLRLCGNGVYPAQAELAFRTLWEKMSTGARP